MTDTDKRIGKVVADGLREFADGLNNGPQKQPFVCALHEFWSYTIDDCPTCLMERVNGRPSSTKSDQ